MRHGSGGEAQPGVDPEGEGGLKVANLPDYHEALASAHAELRAEIEAGEWPAEDLDRLDRLMHRPCMAKVYRALAARLPAGPEAWRLFLSDALLASLPAESWRDTIRPGRHRVEQQRAAALRAGRDLVAALRELTDGMHGFQPPAELERPADLLQRAAIRKGYTWEDAHRLAEPLAEDAHRRRTARIEGLDAAIAEAKVAGLDAVPPSRLADCPPPPAVVDLAAALLHTLEAWKPGQDGDLFPGQTQGGKAPQVYVRALAHGLDQLAALLGITPPRGRLLSYDNLARVTRAALDLPDSPPSEHGDSRNWITQESRAGRAAVWKPFNAKDVKQALGVVADYPPFFS